MKINPLDIYKPLFLKNKPRYFIFMGGRASGRSYASSQYAMLNLLSNEYFRCAIMRYVLGDIRNSIFQEIKDRLEEQGIDENIGIKENRLEFSYKQNKINGIGFRKSSGDQKAKLKSLANYSTVIIEEADEVSEEDFIQLDDSIRTLKSDVTIILLLNPPHKDHWIIKRWFNLVKSEIEGFYIPELKSSEKDTYFVHGTYKDNEINLNSKTVENFEKYKTTNPDHYHNMIKGLVSEGARGRIFKNWKPISDEEYEQLPYMEEYSLDFGYSNDPTAVIGIKKHNEDIYTRELIYETGLTNKAISDKLDVLNIDKSAEIICDSAEPKSIQELVNLGWNAKPADKGPDSVRNGISYLLSKNVHYTESSTNIATEIQNYKWALDRNKMPTNKPIDDFNHAIDAIRYGTVRKTTFVGFV